MPGAVPPLLDDTGDCTLILIFPRDQRAGGCVDHHHTLEDPYDLACKVFLSGDNPHSADTLRSFQYIKEGEELDMELYQADIRSRFLEILGHSGIIVNQFPSLDRDEDFVTLSLPLEGPTIQFMAQRQGGKCRNAVILGHRGHGLSSGIFWSSGIQFFLGFKQQSHHGALSLSFGHYDHTADTANNRVTTTSGNTTSAKNKPPTANRTKKNDSKNRKDGKNRII